MKLDETSNALGPGSRIQLTPATRAHETTLSNLLQLYMHDFSDLVDVEIGSGGRFAYPHLPLYFTEPHHHAFLVTNDEKLAGFAFVQRRLATSGAHEVWDMAEFFILRGYRRLGMGIRAAHLLWKQFPGPWEIRVMQSNLPAQKFWLSAIAQLPAKSVRCEFIDQKHKRWQLFCFDSTLAIQK